MIPDNFNRLSLKAQFRIVICHIMEQHGKRPCHLYHDTRHHYNFIRDLIHNDVDHKFDTAEYLMEKLGYKLVLQYVPLSELKKDNEHEK